ncbi:YceI family protein [Paraflavitalea pollutisoli]|uniref:YceI family protein n=1 Tax=Paraflavitalea pollutisoli TaxID=3034143 RepID=UPI0023EB12C7|nr:YceI family protein [Paraflavitalea sp. H1-2-19X]
MKKLMLIAAAFITLSAFTAINSLWKNDPPHTQLGFTVTHLGINDVTGYFRDFEVSIESTKPDFTDAVFTLTAKTASIDTRVEQRDNHLRSADFFDVEQYPALNFKSTSIKKGAKNTYKLAGELTLHGVTKPVIMDLEYRGTTANPMSKKPTAGFRLTGTIKRSDFGIGTKFPATLVSDDVRIKADGEFTQP